MDEWAHRFVATKHCPTYGPTYYIKVEAGLHKLKGNNRPYFSVTAEITRPRARDCEACGCLHDEVLKMWPELAPVVALHLSDDRGQPTHAEANGWYWLAGYYSVNGYLLNERYHGGNSQGNYGGKYRQPTSGECLQIFADHVRIPFETARQLAESWRCDDDPKSSRRWYQQWTTAQADRWQQEATAAITLLDQLSERSEHGRELATGKWVVIGQWEER